MVAVKELIELQKLNSEINSKRRRLAEIEARMDDNQELRQARAVLERTQSQFQELEAALQSVEWDLDQTRARIAKVEQRLMGDQVTNPRELQVLQHEIGNLRQRQSDLEDVALAAMDKVERARPVVESRQDATTTLESKWNVSQSDMDSERQEIEAALPVLEKDRDTAKAAVPAAPREKYMRIAAKKGGVGISKLQGSTCSECRVSLPSQHAQQVRMGRELITCNNCGRILYA